MHSVNFEEVVETLVKRDPRYDKQAYVFVREALDHTQKIVHRNRKEEVRHVSGQELLAGVREYATEQYGPMALMLLGEWGLRCGEDIGEIVFNMVEIGLLAKTEADSREDFKGGYDFDEAFRQPYLPAARRRVADPEPRTA